MFGAQLGSLSPGGSLDSQPGSTTPSSQTYHFNDGMNKAINVQPHQPPIVNFRSWAFAQKKEGGEIPDHCPGVWRCPSGLSSGVFWSYTEKLPGEEALTVS